MRGHWPNSFGGFANTRFYFKMEPRCQAFLLLGQVYDKGKRMASLPFWAYVPNWSEDKDGPIGTIWKMDWHEHKYIPANVTQLQPPNFDFLRPWSVSA